MCFVISYSSAFPKKLSCGVHQKQSFEQKSGPSSLPLGHSSVKSLSNKFQQNGNGVSSQNGLNGYVCIFENIRGKYFYLFADLGQGIVSVKSRNREKFLGDFLEPAMMKLDNGIY